MSDHNPYTQMAHLIAHKLSHDELQNLFELLDSDVDDSFSESIGAELELVRPELFHDEDCIKNNPQPRLNEFDCICRDDRIPHPAE